MKKWDDKTDKSIRDSLENLDFPFEEESWSKMEAMLDESEDKPVSTFKSRYGYLMLIILLFASLSALYSVGSYYDVFNQKQPSNASMDSDNNATVANKVDLVEETVYPSRNYSAHVEKDLPEIEKIEKTEKQVDKKTIGQLAKNISQKKSNYNTLKRPKLPAVAETNTNHSNDVSANRLVFSDRKSNDLLALKSRSGLLNSDGFFGSGGIADLTLDYNAYKPVSVAVPAKTLSKEEKKQERANAREIRKKLGKSYRKTVSSGTGRFSLRPLNWGIRLGTGFEIDSDFFRELIKARINNYFPLQYKGINAALFAEYVITERWHLQTEIAYSMLSNISQSVYINDNYFGLTGRAESGYDFSYNLRQLEFIDFQAVVQHKLKRWGTFELGGAVGFTIPTALFTSSVSWSPNTLRRQPEFQNPDKAILKYNLQAILGYEYTISNRFSLNARYYFGLADLTRDSFFGTSSQSADGSYFGGSRLQFSLKIKLNRVRTKSEDE